jgi:formylglycine-generating enzyme required for sulfatase activity
MTESFISTPPEIPAQGYGAHFAIGDDGVITFAPPGALDREGNNVALLKKLHPKLRTLSCDLVNALRKRNIPDWDLRDRVDAYWALVDHDIEHIDFAVLYAEGVHLTNVYQADLSDEDKPRLTQSVRANIDTLLQLHGAFVLATADGIELIAAEERYRRTVKEEAAYRKATVGLAEELQGRPDVIDPQAASFLGRTAEHIASGNNPERSGTVAAGTVKNVTIAISAAASLGAVSVAAIASHSPPLMVTAWATVLVIGKGLEKSKPFAVMQDLATKGFNHVSETDVTKALKDIGDRFKPHLKFVLESESLLRTLAAQRDSGLNWVTGVLDWIKHPINSHRGGKAESPGDARRRTNERFVDFPAAPEMIVVPTGKFMMGSPEGEGENRERPQREVTIAYALAVGICPVTRGEFADFMAAGKHEIEDGAYIWSGEKWVEDPKASWRNPGFAQTDDHPVVCVNWHDAQAYVAWLRERSGKRYKLLTEAEWEYCCRAGTATAYSTGDTITSAQVNFGRHEKGTTAGRRFPPNPWGLYDMHGNVWEWCEDSWHPHYKGNPPTDGTTWEDGDEEVRVLRGGAWDDNPDFLRSACRGRILPDDRISYVGFRVARTL